MTKMKNLKMSQLALCNFPYKKYSLDFALDHLQALGTEYIEFYAADPHLDLITATPDEIKRVAQKIRQRGLKVIDVCPENCTYPVNLAAKNARTRAMSYQYYVNAIHAASEFGSKYVNVFPGWATIDGSQEEAWNYGVDALRQLSDIAEVNGVKIVMEATSAIDTCLSSSAKAVEMRETIKSPALTHLIDTLCLEIMGESMTQAIETIGIENVSHVHFSDGNQHATHGWEHRVPGEGIQDLDKIMSELDAYNYQGILGCEVTSSILNSDDPDIVMKETIKWCKDRFIND